MQVEIIPALVEQLRETMEGNVGASWITDGKADSGVLGFIATLPAPDALRVPVRDIGRSLSTSLICDFRWC